MHTAIVWFRNDLRLADNAAVDAACRAAERIVPVWIDDPAAEGDWPAGAASRAWLARSLAALDERLRSVGSRLLLRRGDTLQVLRNLAAESGAAGIHCNRRVEPAWIATDARVEAGLDVPLHRHHGNLLAAPETVSTGQGTPYRVFTPFWRRLSAELEMLAEPLPAPTRIASPELDSLPLDALGLTPAPRWDLPFWQHWTPGELGAQALLERFVLTSAARYEALRDRPDRHGTSRLSPHLHFGEISPRQIARALLDAMLDGFCADPGPFLRELGWREFGQHLLFHFPESTRHDLSPRFAGFRWRDPESGLLDAWRRGLTGVPIVDAGMRELWQTGWMHNRVRMIVASFLTKHLRIHWLHGARWFWDTLVDADLGNNSLGWQWSAGTGVDAAPYFRIFNPVTQGRRFDPLGRYVTRWLPALASLPAEVVHAPWTIESSSPPAGYPARPIVDLEQARRDALAAWQASVAGGPGPSAR